MKALILKDFYVLKRALLFYAVIIFMFCLMPGGEFIGMLYAALLPTSAFAYDDRSRWGELAAMLPYSDMDIIFSRYILCWLSVMMFAFIGTTGAFVFQTAHILPITGAARPVTPAWFLTAFCLSSCVIACGLPIYFRFDAEKSRLIRIFLIALVCGVMGALYGFTLIASIGGPGTDVDFLINPFITLLAAIIINAVSIPLSLWAYRARRK